MSCLICGVLRMRLAVSVQALCPLRTIKLMTLAGGKTEGDQYGKQCETFHRAPLSHFPVIGNPVSRPGKGLPEEYFLMLSSEIPPIFGGTGQSTAEKHVRFIHAAKPRGGQA